jgi:F-box/leucine-rich repeat protein 2/20
MNPTQWESNHLFPRSNLSSSSLGLTMVPDALGTATEQPPQPERKGKARSSPVEIPSSGTESARPDLFSISLDSHNLPGTSHPGPSSPPVIPNDSDLPATLRTLPSQHNLDDIPYDTDLPFLDKGKARDTPPILPPLTFPPITFDICPSPSFISEPGPSSFGSLHPQHIEHESLSYTPPVLRCSTALDMASSFPPSSPRRRSFSIPVPCYTERLISSVHTGVEIESSRDPNDRSHKHSSSSDRRKTRSVPSSPGVGVQVPINLDAVDAGNCLAPWMRDFRSRSKDKSKAGSYSYLVLDHVGEGTTTALPDYSPGYIASRPVPENRPRKANGRSYSDPYPLPHPFDVVSSYTPDAFVPIHVVNPPNLFDGMLPREVRLRIFGFLVEIYEEDHARRVREGKWTANKAAKHKWVGRDQGLRELMRLKRVSTLSIPL